MIPTLIPGEIIPADGDIEIIGEAKRGDEALAVYRRLRPGVVLMDLQLPGLSGVQATAVLCAHDPQARILIYSTFAHELDGNEWQKYSLGKNL